MHNRITRLLATLAVTFGCFFSLAAPAMALSPSGVLADASKSDICAGIGVTGGDCSTGPNRLNTVVKAALTILTAVAGVAAIIMVVLSGFKYTTSGGDSTKVSSAKTTLIYALVGLAIVAFAQIMVHFVINQTS